jgi:four helix bundle protein
MDSYKASKIWHIGHDLAILVYGMTQQLPENDEFGLAEHLRRTSATVSHKIAESVERSLEHEKLASYKLAREAVIELQEHLSLARDLHYIEQHAFEELAAKAITTHNLLSGLIRSLASRVQPSASIIQPQIYIPTSPQTSD